MRKIVFLFCLLSISLSSFTQLLIPYKKGKLWGYANTIGVIIITPKYDQVDFFDKFGGKVWKDGLMGYVNPKGDELVKPNYDLVKPITDSLFKVQKKGKWQIIDVFGESLFQLQYDYIYILRDYQRDITKNLRCKVGINNRYGLVNINLRTKKGAEITPIEYDRIFTNNKLYLKNNIDTGYFRIYIDKKVGIIKLKGNSYSTIIDPIFNEINLGFGRKIHCRTDEKELIFDEEGNFIRERNLEKKDFENYVLDGEISFSTLDNTQYPQYQRITHKGKQGYITTDRIRVNGDWIIEIDTVPAIYSLVKRIYGNQKCYIVEKNNKWGAVTPNGEYILLPIYDEIDLRSKIIKKVKNQIDRYRFIVRIDDKWGVVGNVDEFGGISNNGYQLIPIIYGSVKISDGKDFYIIQLGDNYGVISAKHYNLITKPKFSEISTKLISHQGIKFFKVKPTKDSEYVYVGENGVEYFEE